MTPRYGFVYRSIGHYYSRQPLTLLTLTPTDSAYTCPREQVSITSTYEYESYVIDLYILLRCISTTCSEISNNCINESHNIYVGVMEPVLAFQIAKALSCTIYGDLT